MQALLLCWRGALPGEPYWPRVAALAGCPPGGGVPANSLRRLLIPPSGGGVPVALCGCAGGARPPGERTPPTPFGCVCRACPPWGWGRAPTPCGCARGARPPEIPLARRPLSVCGRRFQAPQPQPRVPSSGAGRSRFCPEGRRGDRARRGSGRRASPARSGWLGDSGWPGFCTRRREVRVRARPARTRAPRVRPWGLWGSVSRVQVPPSFPEPGWHPESRDRNGVPAPSPVARLCRRRRCAGVPPGSLFTPCSVPWLWVTNETRDWLGSPVLGTSDNFWSPRPLREQHRSWRWVWGQSIFPVLWRSPSPIPKAFGGSAKFGRPGT